MRVFFFLWLLLGLAVTPGHADHPDWTKEVIQSAILKRSAQIQHYFDTFYATPNACASTQAAAGRKDIDLASRTPPEKTDAFPKDIQNR